MNKFIYLRFKSYKDKHICMNYAFHLLNKYQSHNLVMDYGKKDDLNKNGIKYLLYASKKNDLEILTPNYNMLGFKAYTLLKKNETIIIYDDILNKKNKKLIRTASHHQQEQFVPALKPVAVQSFDRYFDCLSEEKPSPSYTYSLFQSCNLTKI